ncbi:MAG: AEC family transporter [Sedimentisphaerales bacterium]|nr:AEC family transporter [Sedimentisphaerales bacterium]
MLDVFLSAFGGTFLAVAKVFLVVLAAGILVRRGIVGQHHVKALSSVTVNVFLPCMIFSNITSTFDPGAMRIWPMLPLAGVAMIGVGLGLGSLVFARDLRRNRDLVALSGLQNAGYLVLPLGSMLFPEQFDQFALYCFLLILGVSPLLWSLGKYLVTAGEHERFSWRTVITPPFCANVLAMILAFTHAADYVPGVLAGPIDMLGKGAVPVANFVLGAVLGSITLRWRHHIGEALRVISVKLVLLPLVTIVTLYFWGLGESYPLMASFLVLQSAAAPATGLIIQLRNYGGNEEKVGCIMLLTYATCILMMPFWLAVWRILQ